MIERAHLCQACRDRPWGPEGWQEFYLQNSYLRPAWINPEEFKRVVTYPVPAAEFFERAKDCQWCHLLSLNLPKGAPGSLLQRISRISWTKLEFRLSFPTAQHSEPELLSKIEVSCRVDYEDGREGGGFTDFNHMLDLGVFAYPGRSNSPSSWGYLRLMGHH
ncbi:hypothetical protein EV356DRAFT_173913 [Viridothelium virens]|uniref:Uncharacterized protein n=1 Tax=Viridothelium virens TaxID=1048519 RepID=A0A6A6H8R0_VIRVR|nr:hypothetical protein EV356DRAFT_173913 [Viridothelium virens]